VEAAGIARAKALLEGADLVLWCVPPQEDADAPNGALVVRTMGDLEGADEGALSAHTGAGLNELLEHVNAMLLGQATADSEAGIATSRRQVDWLETAAQRSADAAHTLRHNQLELAASDLRGACEALAELTGLQEPDEAMLDALFGQFCLGK
jgi:tRNA modification GTPase